MTVEHPRSPRRLAQLLLESAAAPPVPSPAALRRARAQALPSLQQTVGAALDGPATSRSPRPLLHALPCILLLPPALLAGVGLLPALVGVALLYALTVALLGRRAQRRNRSGEAAALAAQFDVLRRQAQPLTAAQRAALDRCGEMLAELLPCLQRGQLDADEVHDLRASIARHLPEAIAEFAALPAAAPLAQAQLDAISRRLAQIRDRLLRARLAGAARKARFLAAKTER